MFYSRFVSHGADPQLSGPDGDAAPAEEVVVEGHDVGVVGEELEGPHVGHPDVLGVVHHALLLRGKEQLETSKMTKC